MTMTDRRIGRTTRMLQAAITAAQDGEYVVVIAGHESQRLQLANTALAMVDGNVTMLGHGDFNIGKGKLIFELPNSFDWRQMRPTGAHPSVRTFVDHHAIELNWGSLLREYHRWDEPA